jgi:predicted secreted protein
MTRPHRWTLRATALLAALVLAACATPEERERRIDTGGRVVALTAGSASTVELRRDQELRVSLALEPNSGREWSLVEMAPGVLEQQGGRGFERLGMVSNFSEAAGADVFRFKPLAAGTTTLKFDFRRPRDLEPATRSLSFTVSVK